MEETQMSWELDNIMWPSVYLLLLASAIFSLWAVRLRRKKKQSAPSWKEVGLVACFCLFGAVIMVIVNFIGYSLSLLSRIGAVGIIMALYAYYSHRRQHSQ
jgi:uncharacterized membrane protein